MIFPAINLHLVHGFPIATLWSFNVAMESVPFICSVTHLFKNGDFLVRKLLNCQTATINHQKSMFETCYHHLPISTIINQDQLTMFLTDQDGLTNRKIWRNHRALAPQWMEASKIWGTSTATLPIGLEVASEIRSQVCWKQRKTSTLLLWVWNILNTYQLHQQFGVKKSPFSEKKDLK